MLIPIFLAQSCSSPLKELTTDIDPTSPAPVIVEKQAGAESTGPTIHLPLQEPTAVEQSLEHRMEEITNLSPANRAEVWKSDIGFNLHLEGATTVPLTVDDAIIFAIENNLDIRIAVLKPAIEEQTVASAEAAFDFIFGAGATSKHSKIPQQQIIVGGVPVNSSESETDTFTGNASLAKQLYGGGTITFSTDITKTDNSSTGSTFSPDPAWQTVGTVDFLQPLMRNFGETVTRAQIHLSEITHGQAKEELRNTLNTVVTSTEHTHLDLSLQWKILQVNVWLLQQGEEVVEILGLRRSYDTGEADYAQAVATVQKRKAEVISQQAIVQKASDTLKQLINTDTYALDSEIVLQPTGKIEANPISISLRQAILTSLENRPDLRKLRLEIQSKSINVQVMDNARMPQLDMQAQMSFHGLGDSAGEGYQEVFDTDFINYLAGLTIEVPLGNRAADANYTSARLQKMSAVAAYKQGIQTATIDVKTALRDILTNAELMRANKDFRIAQAENLRALGVEEETMSGLTPTFLNLKLQTQSGLASARIAEFSSIINYNKSIASLYEAMGTTLQMHQVDIETESPILE